MPKYIDALEIRYTYRPVGGDIAYKDEIEALPTADVARVIHAKWEIIQRTKHYVDGIGIDVETRKPFINKKEYTYDEYRCPVCRKFAKGDYLRFCDYCGAKFDEMFSEDEDASDDWC